MRWVERASQNKNFTYKLHFTTILYMKDNENLGLHIPMSDTYSEIFKTATTTTVNMDSFIG
jgi:hypothetical protein